MQTCVINIWWNKVFYEETILTRRTKIGDPIALKRELEELLNEFEFRLQTNNLRDQVRALVPVNYTLRDIGASLDTVRNFTGARDRILAYLEKYAGLVVDGGELMVVSGISEYARRVRELRVEEGWSIASGNTIRDMTIGLTEEEIVDEGLPSDMSPDQYILLDSEQDIEAAFRWHHANKIRKSDLSVKDKILTYFKANIGKPITSEELKYLAKNRSEWARRTRELRTEEGYPVVTKATGDNSLPIGVYVLASEKRAPPHDRHIPELVRREVMRRDNWSCRWEDCGYPIGFDKSDQRFLEVHHIQAHAKKGSNDESNLLTLCNLHHDETHRTGKLLISDI